MANEVRLSYTTGLTMRFTITRLSDGAMWSTPATANFVTRVAVNWANYIIALTETPAAIPSSAYVYYGTFPPIAGNMVAGFYQVDFFVGTAITSPIASQWGYWNGTTFDLNAVNIVQVLGTLSPAAAGYVALDWGQVANKTTANALTGTTIATTQKVDVETIKMQTVTCGAGVTVLASVGTAATSTAQTGDAYSYLTTNLGALGAAATALAQSAVWTPTVAARIDVAIGSRMATFVYTAPDNAGIGVAAAAAVSAATSAASAATSSASAATSSATAATQATAGAASATTAVTQTTAGAFRADLGMAAANMDTQLAAILAAAVSAASTDASAFTGAFSATVLQNAPTATAATSRVHTAPITAGSMQVYQYSAFVLPGTGTKQSIAVVDEDGNPISVAGRTIEILATSPADPARVLWKWNTALPNDGGFLTIVGAGHNVIQIDADNRQSQTAGDFNLFAWDVTNGIDAAVPVAQVLLAVLPAPQPEH